MSWGRENHQKLTNGYSVLALGMPADIYLIDE